MDTLRFELRTYKRNYFQDSRIKPTLPYVL